MTLNNSIPNALRSFIDGEEIDFIVKSKRNHLKSKAFGLLFFSLFWNAIVSVSVFFLVFEEVDYQSNGLLTTASLENLKTKIIPVLMIGLFCLIGIVIFILAIMMFFQKGGYFVGTETRFIKYRKGTFVVKDWEQFSGNIKVKNKGIYGNLSLELRTGKMKNRDQGSDKFIPDIIHIVGVKNIFDVEKKCRTRIKENDPNSNRTNA